MVGRQAINRGDLSDFLCDEGVPCWSTNTPNACEELVEVAGRLCYKSFANPRPGGNEAYIKHILEVGHGSVLEHAVFSLIITGVSRSFTHELVRHRVGFSYSQLSQRFVDESDCAFVMPPAIQEICRTAAERGGVSWPLGGRVLLVRWMHSIRTAHQQYQAICSHLESWFEENRPNLDKTLRRKAAREAARSVLPNCTETKIFVTGNARAFRHFIELRGSEHADAEIRNVAVAVLGVMQTEAPAIFGDYDVAADEYDGFSIATEHRKV